MKRYLCIGGYAHKVDGKDWIYWHVPAWTIAAKLKLNCDECDFVFADCYPFLKTKEGYEKIFYAVDSNGRVIDYGDSRSD